MVFQRGSGGGHGQAAGEPFTFTEAMAFAARRKPLATATNHARQLPHTSTPDIVESSPGGSPVFDKQGSPPSAKQVNRFVIRAWQHPSGLRSPPKVNAKFMPMCVTMAGGAQVEHLTAVSNLRDSPSRLGDEGADNATASPTPRELYRKRWIRTYEEHSSMLRSSAPESEPVSTHGGGVSTAASTQTLPRTRETATETLHSPAEHRAVAVQSVTMCDAGTQTEEVSVEWAVTQTDDPKQTTAPADISVSEPGAIYSESEETKGEPSAAEQLAMMKVNVQPPSMEELERLEKMLHAEHQKLMGSLGDQPWSNQLPNKPPGAEHDLRHREEYSACTVAPEEERALFEHVGNDEGGTMHAHDAMHLFTASEELMVAQVRRSPAATAQDGSSALNKPDGSRMQQFCPGAADGDAGMAGCAPPLPSQLPLFSGQVSSTARFSIPPPAAASASAVDELGAEVNSENLPATPRRHATGTVRQHGVGATTVPRLPKALSN